MSYLKKISKNKIEKIKKFDKVRYQLKKELRRDPLLEEIAVVMEEELEVIIDIVKIIKLLKYLDKTKCLT